MVEEICEYTWEKDFSGHWLLGYKDGVETDWRFRLLDIRNEVIELINPELDFKVNVDRNLIKIPKFLQP